MTVIYGTDEKKRVSPHFYLLLPAPLEDFRPGYGLCPVYLHQKGPHQGDGGDEQVLRAMVGQLGNFKQVPGDPAHKLAGAVLVVEGEGQILEDFRPGYGLCPVYLAD